jgi:hypothetical protein
MWQFKLADYLENRLILGATRPRSDQMSRTKLLLAAAVLYGGLATASASAMPIANLALDTPANVETARLVCGPYRCWWRPNYYYAPRYYAPRRFYGGWGYRRGWRRW